jgi:hypothetical protein
MQSSVSDTEWGVSQPSNPHDSKRAPAPGSGLSSTVVRTKVDERHPNEDETRDLPRDIPSKLLPFEGFGFGVSGYSIIEALECLGWMLSVWFALRRASCLSV